MSKIIISIVICTHNRADLARDAMLSVLQQDFPQSDYELLLVDNGSADHTREMALEFSSAYPHVRYFSEENIGLAHARNRGWQEAQSEFVGYLDDDAKAAPGWLSAAFDIASQVSPAAFGGPYHAFYHGEKPAWFRDEYGSHIQGNSPRFLGEQEYLSGGNMFIRRDILENLNGFRDGFGMQGKKIAYGEETDFFIRLRSQDGEAKLYYHPAIKIYHLVRKEKFNLWLALKRYFLLGRDVHRLFSRPGNPPAYKLILYMCGMGLRIILSITLDLAIRDKLQYPFYQNYLYEKTFPLFSQLGGMVEALSARPNRH